MKKRRYLNRAFLVSLTIWLLAASPALAQGTAFSYQGKLSNNGAPANGTYDMQFKLFDALTGGNQVGAPVTNPTVAVENGVFTVQLDFGAGAFDSTPRYLEIGVRPANDPNPYTVLSPRQAFSSIPYAMHSVNASAADGLSAACDGCVTNTQINTVDGAKINGEIPITSVPEGSNNYIQNSVAAAKAGKNSIKQAGGFDLDGDGVIGTLAIGTTTPTDGTKLDVNGGPIRLTQSNNRLLQFGSPNSETGMTIKYNPPANPIARADIRFDGSLLKLVAVAGDFVPPNQNGIAIDTGGNVGVGTANLTSGYSLDVNGRALIRTTGSGGVQFGSPNTETGMSITYPFAPPFTSRADIRFDGSTLKLVTIAGNATPGSANGIVINTAGFVGIGTSSPAFKLHVEGANIVESNVRSTNDRAILALDSNVMGQRKVWTLESGFAANPGLFAIYDRTADRTGLTIDGTGAVAVKVLQILGGGDFSESFDISPTRALTPDVKTKAIEPGFVVSIDAANPGKLVVSRRAYDRSVAGIISGAGGINPGLVMGQKGSIVDGKQPVALSGRVWTYCDATRNPIKPGDLLTTSAIPGHAMKARNYQRAQGAIIGKAMTTLKGGRGLVLVLVSLQ